MHNRIFNLEMSIGHYEDYEIFNTVDYRIDSVDEIPEKEWPEEISNFMDHFTAAGLPIKKRENHIKIKTTDLKAYFEKMGTAINDKYGFLFTDENYSEPLTEYEWIKNLLNNNKGKEIISLRFHQIFDYHF